MHKIQDVEQILVINLGGVGDLLLSTPALRALRKLYPKAYIALLTISRSSVSVKDLKYIDEVVIYRGLKDLFNLRKNRFDMVINMRSLTSRWSAFKMAFLFSWIGARYKVGRDTQGRGFFLNIKLTEQDTATMHDVDYNLALVGLLGADTTDKRIELSVLPEDKLYIEEYLRQNQIKKNDMLIGISVGATWQVKRWSIENFSKVIAGLIQNIDCQILVTGTKEDILLANRLKDLSKARLIIATGKTNIGQLTALINRCQLFITNDGGSMHISSILKRPFVAIFGPTDTKRFGSYEPYKDSIVLNKKVDCSPCFKRRCKSLKCLKSIKPEDVLDAAMRILNENLRDNSQ